MVTHKCLGLAQGTQKLAYEGVSRARTIKRRQLLTQTDDRFAVRARADGPASFSPDGRFVAVPSQGRVALLDASSGRLVRQTDVLPGADALLWPGISITWEDASNLNAWDIGQDQNGLFRCAAATAACQPLNLGVGDARVIMAR